MKYPEFFSFAHSLSPLITEVEWNEFSSRFGVGDAEKGKILCGPGLQSDKFHVVLKGIIRNYDIDADGKEFTKVFRGPGGLIGPYAEILSGTPVKYFIQTVTDVQFIAFEYKDFAKMMEKYKSWETLGRRFAELNYLEKEKKEYELMHFNAEERYDLFRKEHGSLTDLIPQYQVASFLGISPEALNRLIKKKQNS